MTKLTFGDCREMLRANGYAPAPTDATGRPSGPFGAMQINYPAHAYDNDPVAILTRVPPPRSDRDPYPNPAAVAIAALTVRAAPMARDEVASILARYIGGATCPARRLADGSVVHVFAWNDQQYHPPAQGLYAEPIGTAGFAITGFIPLGAPDEWIDGIDPLNTPRSSLAALTAEQAGEMLREIDAALMAHLPPPEPVVPFVPTPILEPGAPMCYENDRLVFRLGQNGFALRDGASGTIELLATVKPRITGLYALGGGPIKQTGLAALVLETGDEEVIAAAENLITQTTVNYGDAQKLPCRRIGNERLYLMRASGQKLGIEGGFGGNSFRIVVGAGIIALAGEWPGVDWTELKYDELHELDYVLANRLRETLQPLCLEAVMRDASRRSADTAPATEQPEQPERPARKQRKEQQA